VAFPDAAQRVSGALLIRGSIHPSVAMGPGSAEQREERCTASGTQARSCSPVDNSRCHRGVTKPG